MRPPQFRSLLLVLVWAYGCDFPLDGSKYELAAPVHVEADAGQSSAVRVARLAAAFSDETARCDSCLASSCKGVFDTCADTEGCVEFAECLREKGNPGASAACFAEAPVSIATLSAAYAARECWATCISECSVGRDWSCVNEYAAPRPPTTPIRLEQALYFVWQSAAVGAEVNFCAGFPNCEFMASEVSTDDDGKYSVDLPIQLQPVPLAGWRGVRLVTSPEMRRHVLVRNIPIWSHHIERTGLLSHTIEAAGRAQFDTVSGVKPELPVVSVQIFDCQGAGAGDVVFRMPTSPDSFGVYRTSSAEKPDYGDSTSALMEGSAVLANVTPGQVHSIEALRVADDVVVATASLYVTGDDVTLLTMFPDPAGTSAE